MNSGSVPLWVTFSHRLLWRLAAVTDVQKELARNHFEPAQLIWPLLKISSDDGNGDGGKLDARCTNSTKGLSNNRSIDKVCNSRIRTDNSGTHSWDSRNRFLLTPERQNVARVRKPIRLPSTRLGEVVS